MRILVGYATSHASTGETAERVADRRRRRGDTVDGQRMTDIHDVRRHDAAVLASPIHDQAWRTEATDFLARSRTALVEGVSVRLLSVGRPGVLPRRRQGWAKQEDGQMAARLSPLVRARGHRLFSGVVAKVHLTPGGRAKFRLMGGCYGDFRDRAQIDDWADTVADDLHQTAHRSPA